MEEEFEDISFLDQSKLKKQEDKIKSGEITCNLDSPRIAKAVADNAGARSVIGSWWCSF